MADDVAQLGLVMGVKALVDVSYAAQTQGKDPIVSLVSNGLLFSGLAIFAGVTKFDRLAIALGYVLLLSALMLRGIPLLESSTGLVTATRNRVKYTPGGSSSRSGSTGGGSAGGGGGGGGGGGV